MLRRSNRLRYGAREQKHYCRLFSVIRVYLDELDSGRFIYLSINCEPLHRGLERNP